MNFIFSLLPIPISLCLILSFGLNKASGQVALSDQSVTHLPPIALQAANTMDATVIDIDDDGDLDIVLAIEFLKNVILLNDGTGKFEDASHLIPDKKTLVSPPPYRYYPYHDSEDVVVDDFDNDGLMEIVIVTEDDEINEYYELTNNGIYEDRSDELPGRGITNGITKADIDGDGWIDLILANNGQNFLWYNDHGTWTDQTNERLPAAIDITQDVEFGDYDNDGDLDLLVSNELDNKLLQNDGHGFFTDVSEDVFQEGIGEETREGDFGDVDGDGDLDIYFANVRFFQNSPPNQRLLIYEEGRYVDRSSDQLQLGNTAGSVDADFCDIDNDGDLDLVSGNGTLLGTSHGFTIALNDGKGNFIDHTKDMIDEKIPNLVIDVEVADFNGDGIADVYLCCFRASDRLLIGK